MSADYGTEPNAEMRQMANTMWQMFQALMQEGFTEAQSLRIIGEAIRGSSGQGGTG